jgi:predicted metal-dependent hydrolase
VIVVDSATNTDVPVRVIESARRKKTVSARFVDGTIEIRMPQGLAHAERDNHIRTLTKRLLKKRSSEAIDLSDRARRLARRYELPAPTTISWSSRQNSRWGSCTPVDGTVRISHRLSDFPNWVLDYVIVHELAHMIELNHTSEFHVLVARFPKAERAEGFLIAVSMGHGGSLSGVSGEAPCTTGPLAHD